MGQYDTFRDAERVLYLQKNSLEAKLQSQLNFVTLLQKSELQPCIRGLKGYVARIELQKDVSDLLRIETGPGQLYFRYNTGLFDSKFGFVSRNGGGIKTGNRYASDVINPLLNYSYSVLSAEICKFVHGCGLDAYFGFFHKAETSFPALVYDLIEPFRWLVEYCVYILAVEEPCHGRVIRKDEYAWTREGRVILDDGLIRRFVELLERKLQSERPYRFKHGLKRKDGLSMCQEITIAKITVQELGEYCKRASLIQIPSAPQPWRGYR